MSAMQKTCSGQDQPTCCLKLGDDLAVSLRSAIKRENSCPCRRSKHSKECEDAAHRHGELIVLVQIILLKHGRKVPRICASDPVVCGVKKQGGRAWPCGNVL